MKKEERVIAICGKCKNPIRKAFILRHLNRENYCLNCKLIVSGINPDDLKPISKERFDNLLKLVANSPPLKYKELKERLKKEREKKHQEHLKVKRNTRSRKTSK